MNILRVFLCLAALVWMPALRAASVLEFVHITDSHVADFSGVSPRLAAARQQNQGSADALGRFWDRMGSESPPAFVVHTGDAVEAYCFDGAAGKDVYGQIELFKRIYGRSRIPIYMALGNHDIECYRQPEGAAAPVGDQSVSRQARDLWKRSLACFGNGTYYSLSKQIGRTAYRLLFLDNGENAKVRDPKFTADQLRWVAQQMAAHPRDVFILLMHVPFREDEFFQQLGAAAKAPARVPLLIAGHRHTDGIEEISLGGRPVTQVRTASLASGELHFRRFRLLEDRIEVIATGESQVVKTIPLR